MRTIVFLLQIALLFLLVCLPLSAWSLARAYRAERNRLVLYLLFDRLALFAFIILLSIAGAMVRHFDFPASYRTLQLIAVGVLVLPVLALCLYLMRYLNGAGRHNREDGPDS